MYLVFAALEVHTDVKGILNFTWLYNNYIPAFHGTTVEPPIVDPP